MAHGMSDGAAISLFGDGCRRLFRHLLGQEVSTPRVAAAKRPDPPQLRASSGLREFWKAIQSPQSLRILDLGSASQANVTFITGLGHKLYTEDLLRTIQLSFPVNRPAAEFDPERFFQQNLNYTDGQFDGILCWDLLDFLADPLVKPLVEKLHRFLKPGGTVLSFFHTGQAGQVVPMFQYKIRSEATLQLRGQGTGQLHRHFNNRTIENLFRGFGSIKFYLTRDNLREVISVR